MSQLAQVEKQKTAGFINLTPSQAARKAKLEREEEELKAMEAEFYGKNKAQDDDTESETSEEDEVEAVEDEKDVVEEKANKEAENGEQDSEPLSAEEQTFKKRYGDLRRHTDRKIKELTDQIEKLKTNSTSMPADESELEAWISANPDAARIVEAIAARKAEERFATADKRLKDIDREREEIQRAKAEDAIRKAHPDFDKLRSDSKFHDWADEQSKWIQDALYENPDDSKAVIRVIDLYKMDTGQTVTAKKEKAKALASAVDVKSDAPHVDAKEKPTFSESQVKKNSDKWYEQNEAAITEAIREGRFVYDLTGGAR